MSVLSFFGLRQDRKAPPPDAVVPSAFQGQASDTNEPIVVTDPSTSTEIKVEGRILTAQDGPFDMADTVRELFVLTDQGQFFLSRSHKHNQQVQSIVARARRLKHPVDDPVFVDLSTIRQIYEIAARRGSAIARIDRDKTLMQRRVIELISRAAAMGASDIHLVAEQNRAFVRVRVDGAMSDLDELLPGTAYDLQATAFAMTDTSDATYQPFEYQGARISRMTVDLPANVQAVRLQWDPLAYNGRLLVMRILYSGQTSTSDIDNLGYSAEHLRMIKYMRTQPQGINIISGPTGSGKSTTLKISLDRLLIERNYEINVLTVEDPPEYHIEGARQMPVTNANTPDERATKFQQAISAAMRSDPDGILIGEIRDPESAKLAFEGAMTGHQIWTSLHANNAIGIVDRLRDMGVETYKLTDPSIVTGMMSQRLLRCLCPHCRIPLERAVAHGLVDAAVKQRVDDMMAKLGRTDALWHRGPGCTHCKKGYVGRTVAAEIIIPDQEFMDLLADGRKSDARAYWLERMNGITMLAHGFSKVLAGEVSPVDLETSVGVLKHEPFMDAYLRRT